MSSLSTVEARLPPGFRFHPRDEELICDYLMKWVSGLCAHDQSDDHPLLIQVDLNKCEPWDIPETACVGGKEYYFYSQRDRKYATGLRTNRATISGYWKATGKDRPIFRNGTLIGMRKTLVFYQGRAPKGSKTDWVMHEFRLEGSGPKIASSVKEDWVLCRVFYKNRSELIAGKQLETESGYDENTTSLITEPYNNITFDHHMINPDYQYHHEQVPCFSNFTYTQTSPTFSSLINPGPTINPNINNGTGIWPHNIGNNDSSNYVIKAVLNHHHLTKMESFGNDDDNPGMNMIKGSPSFGEASPDSYLSEVGLSSMWNHNM